MDFYGVGRVSPGFEINDNPATSGRSLGYGAFSPLNYTPLENKTQKSPTELHYGASMTSWVQQDPASLKLYPLPPEGRAAPGFTQGRAVGYGAGLPAMPGFLGKQVNVPIVGAMSVGIIALIIIGAVLLIKNKGKIKLLPLLLLVILILLLPYLFFKVIDRAS